MIPYTHKARLFGIWLERTCGHYWYLIGTRGQRSSAALVQKAWNNFEAYRAAITSCGKKTLTGNPDKSASSQEGVEWKVVDCEGWEECYRMGGDIGNPLDDSELTNPDVNTGKMYTLAVTGGLKHGPISTLPKDCPYPIAVGHPGHVTFFYKGIIWQAQGHCYGTTKSLLSSPINADLTYWYQMPYYDYEDYLPFKQEGEEVNMILQKDCPDGQEVYNYQMICKRLGCAIGNFKDMVLKDANGEPLRTGCDGDYGSTMVTVTNGLCAKYGLPQTTLGTVTDALMGKLNQALQDLQTGSTGIPQAQYDAVVTQLNDANATVASLTQQIAELNQQIANLSAALTSQSAAMTAQIEGLQQQVTGLISARDQALANAAKYKSDLVTLATILKQY